MISPRPFATFAAALACTLYALACLATPAAAQQAATRPPATQQEAAATPAASEPMPAAYLQANEAFTAAAAQARGRNAKFKIGEAVLPFALYDQDAHPLLLPEAAKGKYIIVSFIFTRCQVAAMCPAATSKMVSLQRSLDARGLADKVQLLSITFDPRYDTPEVMRQYAQMFGAKTDNYAFLTGTPELTEALLHRFGILTREADGTIVHTMTTSLIAPDGTLALQQNGANWQTDTFLNYILGS